MHSAFFSYCEGIGWALAAGSSAGALAGGFAPSARTPLALLGAILGAALFFIALNSSDHTAWPGIPLGILVSLPAFALANGLVLGAASRAEGTAGSIAGIVIAAAVVLGFLFLLVAPISLPMLVAVLALLAVRRQRQARKHEGLRVLR
jgi:hypothetical protein